MSDRAPRRAPSAGAALCLGLVLAGAAPLCAQEIRGRVVETSTEVPVALAGVFLIDAQREIVASTLADSLGRYVVRAPSGGEYLLFVQRLGYFETESPLVAITDGGLYRLDIEVRPEPIRLDPLLVTVRNEDMLRWYTLALGVNPNSIPGFRVIQGVALEEARLKAKDNTDFLRWLYVPVSHGVEVCLGHRAPMPDRVTLAIPDAPCGTLHVNGRRVPNEHLETLDKSEIALIALFGSNVELFTYGFDWKSAPARTR